MAEERKQSDGLRLWLWRSLALVLIIVFFTARYLLRDRLEVREVQVGHEILRNTLSTNGRVEPEVNFQFYSPLATTVKAVYVQAGDKVKAGTLLMLDRKSTRLNSSHL